MALLVDAPASPAADRRYLDAPAHAMVLAALWFGYTAVRNLAGDTQRAALGNAAQLLEIESALGVDLEVSLQSAIDWPTALVAANSYYLLHFPLTAAVLAVAYWRSRTTVFPVMRNSLVGSTAVALLVHLIVPLAPPRMLPGFVDTGATFGPDPYSIAGSESANQFAAMPSMHVAWAVLAGYALWHLRASHITRAAALLHPVLTGLVVIVTGHHFVSDVAIGAVLAAAFLVASVRSNRPLAAPTRYSAMERSNRVPGAILSVW